MQDKRLSQEENYQLNKITSYFPNNPPLAERCASYYFQAKKNGAHIPNDKIQIAMKCAYFMAQKSQVVYNLKGQRTKQAGLSLNMLIKAHKHDVIYILKQMFKKITFEDKSGAQDIQNTITEISFLITFSVKLEKTFKYLQMKQIKQTSGYQNTFMSLAWLFYIQAKNIILQRSTEVIDNTCLLSHVISFMVFYGWNYFRSQLIIKNNINSSGIKDISYLVKNKCLEYLKITDMEYYKRIAQKFENFINQKFLQGILKQKQNNDFLSYELLPHNYKRFDQYYMKKIDINNIDERIFFKDRATNFTPSKFTPFGNKGWANKINRKIGNGVTQKSRQQQLSHRILNYQIFDHQERQSSKNLVSPTELKLPQGIIQTPSIMNIPLIQTPISAAMEMFNYLNSKSKKFNQKNYVFTKSDNIILKYIDTIFQKQKKTKSGQQLKKNLVFSLYKIYTHEFFMQNPQQKTCQQIFTAFLAVLIQLVFFVNNIHVEFQQIQKQLDLSTFQQWKVCDFMLKSDKLMPIVLKTHLLDIQVSIISCKIWKNEDMIVKIDSFFSKKSASSEYQQKLCRRIVHQIAYETSQISSELSLLQDSSERVFQLVKGILQHKSQLLFNRHLDQIIICSFYLIFRMQNIGKKFNDVKQAYMQVNPNNRHIHSEIMTRAEASSDQLKGLQLKEGQNHLDIIMFYNKIFVTNVRHILPLIKKNQSQKINELPVPKAQLKHLNGQKSNQHNLAQLLQSPLKKIIPREINLMNKTNQNKGPRVMTPQLFAYSQSPILKSDFSSNIVKNKKIINFQEQQKNLQQENVHTQEKEISQSEIGQFISKRTKPCLSQRSNIQNISPRNQVQSGNITINVNNPHVKQYEKPTIKKSNVFLGISQNGNYQLK